MRRSRVCRVVAVLVAIAVIVSATAALTHGHFQSKSTDKAPCGICMVTHGTSAALLIAPPVANIRTVVEAVIPDLNGFHRSGLAFHIIQDRAPPQI